MDRELIERLAKEAGLAEFGGGTESNIERFAALIAEECAEVLDAEARAQIMAGSVRVALGIEALARDIRHKFD